MPLEERLLEDELLVTGVPLRVLVLPEEYPLRLLEDELRPDVPRTLPDELLRVVPLEERTPLLLLDVRALLLEERTSLPEVRALLLDVRTPLLFAVRLLEEELRTVPLEVRAPLELRGAEEAALTADEFIVVPPEEVRRPSILPVAALELLAAARVLPERRAALVATILLPDALRPTLEESAAAWRTLLLALL